MSKNLFKTPWESDYLMSSNGMYCGFNMPKAKKGSDVNTLPEYAWRKAFLVDDYPACPSNWMRSEGRMASYFVGVQKDFGMWLDFNKNNKHKYDVAIVVSVQGVNPITGLPCSDPCLEQYIDTCPKCKEKFGANRYCAKCEVHWPKQNYICTTGQPNGTLWLDGFKAADGVVRQYLFSEETMKGVASNIIGKDRVYAIGLSFFLSKKQKPVQEVPQARGVSNYMINATLGSSSSSSSYSSSASFSKSAKRSKILAKPQFFSPVHTPINWDINNTSQNGGGTASSNYCAPAGAASAASAPDYFESKNDSEGTTQLDFLVASEVSVKQMEVGAGAKINQKIYDDPETLDYWREEPESIIVVNYGMEADIKKILDAGKANRKVKEEGFLQGIPVGN